MNYKNYMRRVKLATHPKRYRKMIRNLKRIVRHKGSCSKIQCVECPFFSICSGTPVQRRDYSMRGTLVTMERHERYREAQKLLVAK